MVSFILSSSVISFAVAIGLASFSSCSAFELNFPNPSEDGDWVTNATNILNWKANSTDPTFFSVQLLNSNNSELNGNFQIGNALLTQNGTSNIFIDQIPAGEYNVLFVNSSQYALNNPQVFYTSPFFTIRPNGTSQPNVQPNSDSNPDSPSNTGSSSSSTGSSSSSSSSADATLAPNAGGSGNGNGNGALGLGMGMKEVGITGIFGLVGLLTAFGTLI